MGETNLSIACSLNPNEETAIKEISLKTKSIFLKKPIHLMFLFFTPHYKPLLLQETIEITLKPQNIVGIQSPLIIYEDKVISRGITALCLPENSIRVKTIFTKSREKQAMESYLRKNFQRVTKQGKMLFSILPPIVNITDFSRATELSLSKSLRIMGAGFIKKYGIKNFQISNTTIDEGITHTLFEGDVDIDYKKISGFIPIGKSFRITKVSKERGVILEIENKPAANIYKKYLGDTFNIFKKTLLPPLYPIGIRHNAHFQTITVWDFLGDDSLYYLGNLKEDVEAKLMLATPSSLIEKTKETIKEIKSNSKDYDLVMLINSFIRRKILTKEANNEVAIIKKLLGERTKIIGFYSDYQIFPKITSFLHDELFLIEGNSLCMALFKF